MKEIVAHLFSLIFHSFGPSKADYLVPQQFSFYGVRLLVSRPTPNLEDQGIPIRLAPTLDLSGMGDPISSYATAGIALRVSGALKPHHHDKVETPSVGLPCVSSLNNPMELSPFRESAYVSEGRKLWSQKSTPRPCSESDEFCTHSSNLGFYDLL
jgi:hypothetical protein